MKKKSLVLLSLLVAGSMIFSACKKVDQPTTPPKDTGKQTDLAKNVTEIIKASDPSANPSAAKDRKDTLIVGMTAPKGVFNPILYTTAYDGYVVAAIFDSLLTVKADGQPGAYMCDLPTITDNGTKYTFKFKKDYTFTDGSPVTMEDVAFTFTAMCDKSYTGPGDLSVINLKGVKDYKEGKASSVSGIKVVDKNTIEFTLEKANAKAIYTLGGTGILSKAYYGKDYKQGDLKPMEALNEKPMGNGPYKFVAHKKGEEVKFAANDSYWQGKPKVPNLIYKVTADATKIQQLSTGQIDMDMVKVDNDNIKQVKDAKFLDIQKFPTNGYGYIAFNMKEPKYADKRVRQALVWGLNREAIVNAIYQENGKVLDIPQSRVSWAYTDDIVKYTYDTKKAEELLDAAGWKKNAQGKREKDGQILKVTFSPLQQNEGPFNDALISVIKDSWPKIGVEVNIDVVDFNVMVDRAEKGNFDTFFMAWGLTADPDSTNIFGTNGSQNRNKYSNADVDKYLAEGLAATTLAARQEAYKKLYKVLNDDLPYIYVYQRSDMWVINSRVAGFEISPYRSYTNDLWKVELK